MIDEPFVMLGINLDYSRDRIVTAVEKDTLSWPIIYDGWDRTFPIAKEWEIALSGTNFVIDHNGIIRYKLIFGGELDTAINQLIEELK